MVQSVTINLDQIITEVVKYVGYVAVVFTVAWKLSQRITHIELTVDNTAKKLTEHIDRVEKMFDRIWDDRLGR